MLEICLCELRYLLFKLAYSAQSNSSSVCKGLISWSQASLWKRAPLVDLMTQIFHQRAGALFMLMDGTMKLFKPSFVVGPGHFVSIGTAMRDPAR
ncbi:MAG TPA: hypothetical protein VG055_29575 [Planctomycetaceae bacterium]|jgi:hypothetical protein|nr:hypothetical protein [Planctomycetaceae bacterium]